MRLAKIDITEQEADEIEDVNQLFQQKMIGEDKAHVDMVNRVTRMEDKLLAVKILEKNVNEMA